MSNPPTPTLLLLNLPANILCGIDLLSFTTTSTFLGIKNLPPGYHFLFTSPSASLSLRDGFWFHIHQPSPNSSTIVSRRWDPEQEHLVPCSPPEGLASVNERGGPQTVYEKFLTPYRQSASSNTSDTDTKDKVWENLTSHITPSILNRFTQNAECTIYSASSGIQDRDEIPGLDAQEVRSVIGEEQELGMLGIDLKKTWREGAVGRERTEGARDRSWLLGDILAKCCGHEAIRSGSEKNEEDEDQEWGSAVLGQMQICFLMVLTLANYSCLEEWKRILTMVFTCESAVHEHPGFFEEFLRVSKRQLERTDDVEGGLFDMSDEGAGFLRGLLKGFKRIVEQPSVGEHEGADDVKEEFVEVEKWVKEQYGWELGDEFVRKGMLELEDGETVEMETGEMEREDESGEYAPVVVEL
ncbi:MAG: hypothetical protein Q9183_003063 [Haloplaca sp. 2 TL-2023]